MVHRGNAQSLCACVPNIVSPGTVASPNITKANQQLGHGLGPFY